MAETGAALRPWARRAYVNYLPPSTPERIREIYGVNYPRLARIKARYDSANPPGLPLHAANPHVTY